MARATGHHWNGIEISSVEEHDGKTYDTIKGMREWEVLGGKCGRCGRISWVDKRAVMSKLGNQYLLNVARHFKCACGNKNGNRVMIGSISRNV